MSKELFEGFHSMEVKSLITKNWSVTYKGKEVSGTFSYESDDWGFSDRSTDIDKEHLDALTEDEIDEILEYVENIIEW
jgi:hypothetical protein